MKILKRVSEYSRNKETMSTFLKGIILLFAVVFQTVIYCQQEESKSFFEELKKDPFFKVVDAIKKTIDELRKNPNIDCVTRVAIEYIDFGIFEISWDPYKFDKDNPQRKVLLGNHYLALVNSYIILERINTYADVILKAVENNDKKTLERIAKNLIKYVIISFNLKNIVKEPCSNLEEFYIKQIFGFGECADTLASQRGFKALREEINKIFPQTRIDTVICNCSNIYPLDRVYWISMLHDIPVSVQITKKEDLLDPEKKKGFLVYDKFNSTFMQIWLATLSYEFPNIYKKMLKNVIEFGKGLVEESIGKCQEICRNEQDNEFTQPLELKAEKVFKLPEDDFGKKCIKDYNKYIVVAPQCKEIPDLERCKKQLYYTTLYYNYLYRSSEESNGRSIAFWCELFKDNFKIFPFYEDSVCSKCVYLEICKCDQIKKIKEERAKEEKEERLDCSEEILSDRFFVDMPRFKKACFPEQVK